MHDFVLPIGPQHPAWVEPVHLKLFADGETITDVDLCLGYLHRGMEQSFETREWLKNVFLSERVCGICCHSHTSTFVQGVETIMGLKVPARGLYIRAITCELERIHSHLLVLATSGHVIGLDTAFHYLWRDREYALEILELISGGRVHHAMNTIGGVRKDIDLEQIKKIEQNLDIIEERAKHYIKVFNGDTGIKKRMKGVARLSAKQAEELCVVGPVARASGLNYDVRSSGYFVYDDLGFKPILSDRGDNHSRMMLRFQEILQSVAMIRKALIDLPKGDYRLKLPNVMNVEPGRETVSRTEAPRGELLYYMRSAGLMPERVRIRTPTYANFGCMKEILVGGQIADAPITVVTLDPCIACCDRMVVVDDRTGNQKVFSHHELEHWNELDNKWK